MTDTPIRPCGATLPALNDAGWECTGRGLVVIMHTGFRGGKLPIVLPARALEIVDRESWWDPGPLKPFTGGDHVHLCVPRRPPPRHFVSDAVLVIGDLAMPMGKVTLLPDEAS